MRQSIVRSSAKLLASAPARPTCYSRALAGQSRASSTAISNPTLANIENRWTTMAPQEQADLWMALRDRMKVDWHQLTPQEKKAAYWIAFGPHGPRAEGPADEGFRIVRGVGIALLASLAVFATIRSFAGPPPKTMSKEWQEATNEYMKRENIEPITGVSSEGYKGPGQVQSKSTGLVVEYLEEEEDDE